MSRTIKGLLALAFAVAGTGTAIARGEETLQLAGSTTVGPIADAFAEAFMARHKGVKITVSKIGSGGGAAALIDGKCDIANMSRFMKEKEFKKAVANGVMPVAHVVALDGVCVALHKSNPITHLSSAQIKRIYKGEITNWKELGGPDLKIVPFTRDSSSGTYETFHKLVMNKEAMAGNVGTVATNPEMQESIKVTAGGIGYVGLGFTAGVKVLEVDGVLPSKKTVQSGVYPISRPLFMFTNGYPKLGSLVYQFVTYHLTEEGEDIIKAKDFVPVTSY